MSGIMISKLISKALHEYRMIEPGDSVLLGLSGGKDSTTLLLDLAEKRRHGELDNRLEAVHVASEFTSPTVRAMIEQLCAERNVPLHVIELSVRDRLKPGRTMNCYWCSTQRRTELLRFACAEGFTKIALGHHLDDILETLFMNMLQKAELSTMPPVMRYLKYPVTIVRPLALVEERQITEHIRSLGLDRHVCTCGFNTNSYRDQVRSRIEAMTGGSAALKRNIYRSLGNIKHEYLA
jgi:tRNA 2-thiocytidine biosynthesis protein TtcA